MPAFECKVEGLAQLQDRLRKLSTDDAQRFMSHALAAGAEVFKREEQDRAPERPDLPSGTALPPGALRRDVIITRVPHQPIFMVRPGRLTNHAAHLVEYGHELVRGGRVVGQVPAHPYARPAFEAGAQGALEAVADSLKQDFAKLDARGSDAK